jgi:hypothetical protein
MAAINLCLNGLVGEISWMNSLSLEHWGGYSIYLDEKRCFVPTIKKLEAKDGHIYQYSLMAFSKMKEDKPESKNEEKIIRISQTRLDL